MRECGPYLQIVSPFSIYSTASPLWRPPRAAQLTTRQPGSSPPTNEAPPQSDEVYVAPLTRCSSSRRAPIERGTEIDSVLLWAASGWWSRGTSSTEANKMIAQSVADILRHRITLEVEGIGRLYLNVYVPTLQTEGGVAQFFRVHQGKRSGATSRIWRNSAVRRRPG